MKHDKMQALLTSRKTRLLLEIPASTLDYWVRESGIRPIVPAEGRGTSRMLTVQQAWAIGIAKSVRGGGQSVEIACEIARVVEGFDPKDVEKAFAEGRTCLFVIGVDGKFSVMPRLVSPDSITNNPELRRLKSQAGKDGLTTMFTGIDVRPMLDQLVKAVEAQP